MKLKSLILFGFLSLFLFAPNISLAASSTANTNNTLSNLETTVDSTGGAKTALTKMGDIQGGAASVIGTILSFVGVAFLILMIYGGILWMVSQGNDTQIKKAKDIIINGIIGLVVVIFAYAITSYIGGSLSGSQNSAPTPAPETPYVPYSGPAN